MKLERLDSAVQIMDNYSKTHVCLFFFFTLQLYIFENDISILHVLFRNIFESQF